MASGLASSSSLEGKTVQRSWEASFSPCLEEGLSALVDKVL